ncbi:MAG TPA: hypothetical protein VKG45_10170 [Actinomycetes bacterium]|nr:hypothetical protein [Actinomycetes bacterium]
MRPLIVEMLSVAAVVPPAVALLRAVGRRRRRPRGAERVTPALRPVPEPLRLAEEAFTRAVEVGDFTGAEAAMARWFALAARRPPLTR